MRPEKTHSSSSNDGSVSSDHSTASQSDIFGPYPAPMDGGRSTWNQFQRNFSESITQITSILRLDNFDGARNEVGRTLYNFLNRLETQEKEEAKKNPEHILRPIRIL